MQDRWNTVPRDWQLGQYQGPCGGLQALPPAGHVSASPGGYAEPPAVLSPLPCIPQAQLIHDRNTAAHAAGATRSQAPPTPDKVQMTWTKEKLTAERHKDKSAGSAAGFRDLFSLKP